MKKLLISLTLLIFASQSFAQSMNSLCLLLDKILPGNVVVKITVPNTDYKYIDQGVIAKNGAGLYSFTNKNDQAIFTLLSVGSGEAIKCVISFNNGISSTLTHINYKPVAATFKDKIGPIITITKK